MKKKCNAKLHKKTKPFNISLGWTMALMLMASVLGCASEEPYLKMDILNTGKSDCIIIQMGDKIIVNDAADDDDYKLIASVLDDYKIKNIDYFIISHFDKDHIGSAFNIINNYKIGKIFAPHYEKDSKLYRKLIKAANSSGVPISFLTNDYTIETSNGFVKINAPMKKVYDDENNYSLITSVCCKGYNLLLCGDALEQRIQEFNSVCKDSYSFIKLPHHGSYNVELKAILYDTKPLYAAVTAESKKRLDSSLLADIDALGIQLYKNYNGQITVNITDKGISIEQ